MGASVSHKLSGSIQGALAGGGDPATSPLYVFGPFLKLLVAGGVAGVCFGASIWMAVITVITVSAMYYLVMQWVTDGSGGSGLNEEEFGPWAVKINAGITIIEYTLTFLVSISALVTFVADRLPSIDGEIFSFSYRTYLAVIVTIFVSVIVNRGPKISARIFGPATAAVLGLLWIMIFATIWKFGLHLPPLKWEAFNPEHLELTLGGYARILALMTGIEIFANLVAAYEGPAKRRSKKAFGSLLIIMGTTSLTMLIVGPAILKLADPLVHHPSVFTQTMDALLPPTASYIGSLIGIAVLLSAGAAAFQGLQNLFLGLRFRHYIPASFGQRNKYEVSASPVWLMMVVCSICFFLFGTHEETYLALYAAGVFILLSLTGWAVMKRLIREWKPKKTFLGLMGIAGVSLSAVLTTIATFLIFQERFFDGAWLYLVLVPLLYLILGHYRNKLGAPKQVEDRLGMVISSSNLSQEQSDSYSAGVSFDNILVPLDQSPAAEFSLAGAQSLARNYDGNIDLINVVENEKEVDLANEYLDDVIADLSSGGYKASSSVTFGDPTDIISNYSNDNEIDLICMTTQGRTLTKRLMTSHITSDVISNRTPPVLVMRPTDNWRSTRTTFKRLLVPLDGSETAEQILPYVHEIAYKFNSSVTLISTSEGSESDDFASTIKVYLEKIKESLNTKGIEAEIQINSTDPTQTILNTASELNIDLIMLASHGRGGLDRREKVKLGSVVDSILQKTLCPVFLTSAG